MDWSSKHRAIVYCDKRTVLLRSFDLSDVTVHGIQFNSVTNVISAMQARCFLKKDCEAFLAFVLDSKRGYLNLEDILLIKKFPDMFPEELQGLPPKREVDMSIEVVPGTTPI